MTGESGTSFLSAYRDAHTLITQHCIDRRVNIRPRPPLGDGEKQLTVVYFLNSMDFNVLESLSMVPFLEHLKQKRDSTKIK